MVVVHFSVQEFTEEADPLKAVFVFGTILVHLRKTHFVVYPVFQPWGGRVIYGYATNRGFFQIGLRQAPGIYGERLAAVHNCGRLYRRFQRAAADCPAR